MAFLLSIAERLSEDAPAAVSSSQKVPQSPSLNSMVALIVGPPTSHHEPIEETLRDHGHEVFHGETVQEAWTLIEQKHPYLVVLTRIDTESLALARRIREARHREAVILLAMVAPEDEAYMQGILEAEVDDCISQQADPAYLKARLALAVRRSQRRVRRHQIEVELAARLRQQAVVAELGQYALDGMPMPALLEYAVEASARALDVAMCKVLKYLPEDGAFVLKAGVGWKEGLVGTATVAAGEDSQAGYTLLADEPVVVEDLRTEARFSGSPLLADHGVVSGISVLLKVDGAPFGVMGAHTAQPRSFLQDDVNFLQAVAHVLAATIERRQTDEALRESENKFRTLAENIPGVVYLCANDEDYSMLYINDAVEVLTGIPKEDFLEYRTHLAELFHPDDRDAIYASVDQALKERRPFRLQYRVRHRSGQWRWVEETGVGVFENDEVIFLEGFLTDVTERVEARLALQESEARTRTILETTVDGIVTIDEQGRIESFNTAAEHIFGYRAEDVIGQSVNMLMPAPYREEHDSYVQNYLETGHRKIIGIGREVVGLRSDGAIFPMDLAVSELVLENRRIFTGIVRDVSKRRSLEQEILRISDQERRRIGQDLHDGLGQMLTGIGLITKNLARTLDAQDYPGAEEVAEVAELLKEADLQARGLARGLMPVDLEASGLSAALLRLAVNAERLFGIRCTFDEVGSVLIDDNSVATHLYRIAQESVSNAVKHGRAEHVRISLASGRGQVRLRIQDDGLGFPEQLDDERRGMGVRIMHYRARVIGATLEIVDGLDGGTTITCTLRYINESIHLAEDLEV